ncbi:tRNA glutamyl-Q(34) synthetase GluQRS [Ferruginivarius sediminum]|uniref:tRNA glutamyl-Q(34) synthetase GluQRS n=1 Tax=Ferruginivarius sediminum TaxID=2661937 RepID=A0A369TAZ8_9PROT|nr:tRNA glutamyl-Q(34) synthetase GluQRS [Ferruginivarius sediminum]RDD62448.1 tRNA glutamyl-Q(34) synthetase GluQRS [Ferruginivarius sediminum]
MPVVTRFAPSPTGDLHLGHAYSAFVAWNTARQAGGRFLVRMEDIDTSRCREEFVERNLDDLHWLGLDWDGPVVRQSQRMDLYADALARLGAMETVYPCFCTRKDIRREIEAAGRAPHLVTADGSALYPGTCRELLPARRAERLEAGEAHAIRLDSARAARLSGDIAWTDRRKGRQPADPGRLGDVVVARKDIATSYHLAVVVDDAAQGITEVTRGEDLFEVTHLHRMLQALLGLPEPIWHHHPLCRDEQGERLAKRKDGTTIRSLREQGYSAVEVLALARASAGK